MSAHCNHLLGYLGHEGEIELRVTGLPGLVASERVRLQVWMEKSGHQPWVGQKDLAKVKSKLRRGGAALLEGQDVFKHCPDCGVRIPPLRELLP